MSNKLVDRYHQIESDMVAIGGIMPDGVEALQVKMAELEARQVELKETLQHLIALSHLRDNAWRTLSYQGKEKVQ